MNARKTKSIISTIDKHMQEIAKTRDKIDGSIDELKELREECRRAYDSMMDARDALSELV